MPASLDRCVKKLKGKNGSKAWAICQSSRKKKKKKKRK